MERRVEVKVRKQPLPVYLVLHASHHDLLVYLRLYVVGVR